MTDRVPVADERPQDDEEIHLDSASVSRPGAADGATGAIALPEEPSGSSAEQRELALAHEAGVELKARSQWAYARIRFVRHKLAMFSLIVLILLSLIAIFAGQVAPYTYDEAKLDSIDYIDTLNRSPTFEDWNLFGTDQIGRDTLSRVIYGMRTSLWVAAFVAILSTAIGAAIGAAAGYFGGAIDNLLMRFTDLILTLPGLAVLLVAAQFFGGGIPWKIGLILALLFWTGIARIVRGLFLSLREKEFVEAAKAAGASDFRIIVRHMLPNTTGPIIVNMTLILAAAILVEAALSFLGFGIQPPHPALGKLINDGQGEGTQLWWLVTFPGIAIVVIALAINFIGDGLRDALDPTQRRARQ